MNYQLTVAIFTKEMGKIPIKFFVNVPESLAKALMNTTIIFTRFAIAQNIKPFTISGMPLERFDTGGIILPDRVIKDKHGHIKIDGK